MSDKPEQETSLTELIVRMMLVLANATQWRDGLLEFELGLADQLIGKDVADDYNTREPERTYADQDCLGALVEMLAARVEDLGLCLERLQKLA